MSAKACSGGELLQRACLCAVHLHQTCAEHNVLHVLCRSPAFLAVASTPIYDQGMCTCNHPSVCFDFSQGLHQWREAGQLRGYLSASEAELPVRDRLSPLIKDDIAINPPVVFVGSCQRLQCAAAGVVGVHFRLSAADTALVRNHDDVSVAECRGTSEYERQVKMSMLKALFGLLSFVGFTIAVLVVVWRTVLERVEGNTVVSVLRLLQQGWL